MDGRMVGFAAALAVVLAGAEPAKDSMFVRLFDGSSLAGWVPEHTDRFAVRDGVILNDGGTGWLRSAKPYKDFELQAEYRALKKGADSGLMFRASAGSTPKDPHWPAKGYQLQVVDADSNFMIFGHGTPTPAKFERKADALRSSMKGPGEWQAITLKVVGKHAEATLNGTPVTTSEAIDLPEGYIGLQGENGQFEWREIKIRELPGS